MRAILLHVHEDDCMEARFQVALDIARQFGGHITCVQAIPYDFGIPGDFYGATTAAMIADYNKDAKTTREKLEARLGKEDIAFDWVTRDGQVSRIFGKLAPLSDIAIFGARNPIGDHDTPSHLVGQMVGAIRPPMLVVPAAQKSLLFGGPVAVAWNGSAEAAHAVRDAMPILHLADEVHILSVTEPDSKFSEAVPVAAAAKYLSRHGIEAEIIEIPHRIGDMASVANKIFAASQVRDAKLLVMGGYGHTRLRERLLGGVTHDMLKDPALPLLISH